MTPKEAYDKRKLRIAITNNILTIECRDTCKEYIVVQAQGKHFFIKASKLKKLGTKENALLIIEHINNMLAMRKKPTIVILTAGTGKKWTSEDMTIKKGVTKDDIPNNNTTKCI